MPSIKQNSTYGEASIRVHPPTDNKARAYVAVRPKDDIYPEKVYHTRNADILVVATGKRNIVTADMVKPGAVVLDVGMNRDDEGKLAGDRRVHGRLQ